MICVLRIGLAVLSLSANPTAAVDVSPQAEMVKAPPACVEPAPPADEPTGPRVGGETIETAYLIPSQPFSDTGNTCGFSNDYEEVCPYHATARDVVYKFVAGGEGYIDIDLCASGFDTKLYVYRNFHTPGLPYACNDDACGASGYRSRLDRVRVTPGESYYIVVDGYGSSCGQYALSLVQSVTQDVTCPPGATIEGEPYCHDGYVDRFNGGCCCDTLRFSVLEPEPGTIHVCGTGGTFVRGGADYRDTDWYEINPSEAMTLDYCGIAEFPLRLYLIDGRNGCENYQILDFVSGADYQQVCIQHELDPGRYWLWAGASVFDGVVCGSDYVLTVDGYHPPGASIDGRTSGDGSGGLALSCRPGPFSVATTVEYGLSAGAPVKLAIYAPDGRQVKVLIEAFRSAGRHEAIWDGRDEAGRRAASGVYLCVLEAGGARRSRPVALLR